MLPYASLQEQKETQYFAMMTCYKKQEFKPCLSLIQWPMVGILTEGKNLYLFFMMLLQYLFRVIPGSALHLCGDLLLSPELLGDRRG